MTPDPPVTPSDVESAGERVLKVIKLSCDPTDDFPAVVAAGLRAALVLAAAEPTLVFQLFGHSLDLEGSKCQERWRNALAAELRATAESKRVDVTEPPPITEPFLIAGVGALALRRIRAGEAGTLERLVPELLVLVLCSYYPTPTEARAAALPWSKGASTAGDPAKPKMST